MTAPSSDFDSSPPPVRADKRDTAPQHDPTSKNIPREGALSSNMGGSILLSFLVVAAAAVMLYPSKRGADADKASATAVEPFSRRAGEASPVTPTRPMGASAADVAVSDQGGRRGRPAAKIAVSAHPDNRPAASAFTQAGPRESLADIAERVYGDRSKAELLWKSNRDQLQSPNDDPEPGTILRTP